MSVIIGYYCSPASRGGGGGGAAASLRPVLKETLNTVSGAVVTFATPMPVSFQILRGYGLHYPERVGVQSFRFEQPVYAGEIIQLVGYQ